MGKPARMIENSDEAYSSNVPLQLRWDASYPLPTRLVIHDGHRSGLTSSVPAAELAFNFSFAMSGLCRDISARCESFSHIRMSQVLVSYTPCRNRSRFGLQARLTPMRFRHGALRRQHGSLDYQVQRFFVDDREMLYLLTFCLPRFLEQPFEEKLITVFHELYHISPTFDGDLRRHSGRYSIHSHSKAGYDSLMRELVKGYLADHPYREIFAFLHFGFRELWDRNGGIVGSLIPRPKLLPVGNNTVRAVARNQRK
jgi:hypothetical protein